MPIEFSQLAESAFGRGWQSKLARTFGINVRTVRRWAAGDSPVPKNIMVALEIMNNSQATLAEKGE